MKKLLLFVSVLTLGLTSCSEDDNSAATTGAALEGRWERTKEGVVVNGQEDLQDWDHTEGCTKDYSQFTANTFTQYMFYNSGNGCGESVNSNNYTRTGNTITVADSGQSYTMEILQLDNNTLKIKDGEIIHVYKRVTNEPIEPILAGTWEYFKEGVALNGQESLQDYQHADGCTKDYTEITLNTATDHLFYNDGSGCSEETGTATYTRNGNILTVTIDGSSTTAEILQLDESTLKLKTSETYQGQTINYITIYNRL